MAWTGSEESYQGFVDQHGLTFPQINDDPGEVFSRFDVAFPAPLRVAGFGRRNGKSSPLTSRR